MITTPFDALLAEISAYLASVYPREGCGLIVDGAFVPIENTAKSTDEFAMPVDTVLKYPKLQAVVHSHPDGPDAPSEADMRSQMAMGVPWGLCSVYPDGLTSRLWYWGSDAFTPPLIGRDFRHGPSGSDGAGDCYALIRDWYRLERGVYLPDFPRSDGWWERGEDLYATRFRDAGFREIPASEARDGDVFFMKILSSRENHAGILTDNCQLILHHLSGRLSRQEPIGRWAKLIERWVRYEP